jgi:cell division protein FtsQ
MSLQEVQERIRIKKKRRRRRRMMFLSLLLLIAAVVFLVKAPFFQITEVTVTGNDRISLALIQAELDGLKGQNIFTFSGKAVEEVLSHQQYFDSLTFSRTLPDGLSIAVKERKAEVAFVSGGVTYLLTRNSILLEMGGNIEEGMTILIDDTVPGELGEKLYEEESEKGKLLREFRYLQERNISETYLDTIDMSDMAKVRTVYQGMDIILGYRDGLKDKLNKAINIIEGGNLQGKTGYIDMSYPEKPVLFMETVEAADDTEDAGDAEPAAP